MRTVLVLTLFSISCLVIVYLLAGCADHRPTCYDNPRNMSCMTADQLERELNK